MVRFPIDSFYPRFNTVFVEPPQKCRSLQTIDVAYGLPILMHRNRERVLPIRRFRNKINRAANTKVVTPLFLVITKTRDLQQQVTVRYVGNKRIDQ